MASSHPSNETYSLNKEELGNTSLPPRASTFEPTDLKSLQGRHNYHLMSSNEVMQEMVALKVAAKNAEDDRARAIGMHKGTSLALKAKVVEQDEEVEVQEDVSNWHPKDLEDTLKDYIALTSRAFWKSPCKAKELINQ